MLFFETCAKVATSWSMPTPRLHAVSIFLLTVHGNDAAVVINKNASFCQETEHEDGCAQSYKSQRSYIAALASESAMKAYPMSVHPFCWICTNVRRVCRSALMAETHALSNGFERGLRLGDAVVDMKGKVGVRRWEETASASASIEDVLFIDCESLFFISGVAKHENC